MSADDGSPPSPPADDAGVAGTGGYFIASILVLLGTAFVSVRFKPNRKFMKINVMCWDLKIRSDTS
jgi:hypothetical protein